MENNQLFPFERNRYYTGKLLTSTDFYAEQAYMNNKRRFVNNLMFGSGVVCGLSVLNLDDLSVMIESGVAIDSHGREIVIESSIVKKLSAIDGFDQITANEVVLCLKYKEKAVHPVYSVSKRDMEDEYEYNRISEGYELFLKDAGSVDKTYRVESEFFSKTKLYNDSNLLVELIMPATVSSNKHVKVCVEITQNGENGGTVEVDATLQTPAFTNEAGEHVLEIHTGSLRLESGEKVRREYWILAQEQECSDTTLIGKGSDIKIYTDGIEQSVPQKIILRTAVSKSEPRELITKEIGKISLEMREMAGTVEYIPLAGFNLIRTDSAYIVDSVVEDGIKRYIPTLGEEDLRSEYSQYFGLNSVPTRFVKRQDEVSLPSGAMIKSKDPMFATGVCEIPFGASYKRGEVRFSGEIMHGLGKGNVYVDVAVECTSEDKRLGKTLKSSIYGNMELFSGITDVPVADTAVRVLDDKGSFVIAAKLLRDVGIMFLTLRWVAIKLPTADSTDFYKLLGKSIVAETPTVVLLPKESHYFGVQFKDMEPTSLTYMLTEPSSGEISPDGVYTAPSKDGVYEIKIICTDMQEISTYAYAVVKQDKKGGRSET